MEIESIKKNIKDLDDILSQCVELEEETFREKRTKLINSFKGAPISLDGSGSHFIISQEQIHNYESELLQSNLKLIRIKQTIDQTVEQKLMVEKNNNFLHQKNVELLTKVETLTHQINSLEKKVQADEREASSLRVHIEKQNEKINSLQEEVKFLEIKALQIQSQKDVLLKEVGERVTETRNICLTVPPKAKNEDYLNKYLQEKFRADNLEVLLEKAEQNLLSLQAEKDSIKKKGQYG